MQREFVDDDVPTSLKPLDAAEALGPVTEELGGIWECDIPLTKGEKNSGGKYRCGATTIQYVHYCGTSGTGKSTRCQVFFKKLLEHEQPEKNEFIWFKPGGKSRGKDISKDKEREAEPADVVMDAGEDRPDVAMKDAGEDRPDVAMKDTGEQDRPDVAMKDAREDQEDVATKDAGKEKDQEDVEMKVATEQGREFLPKKSFVIQTVSRCTEGWICQ